MAKPNQIKKGEGSLGGGGRIPPNSIKNKKKNQKMKKGTTQTKWKAKKKRIKKNFNNKLSDVPSVFLIWGGQENIAQKDS